MSLMSRIPLSTLVIRLSTDQLLSYVTIDIHDVVLYRYDVKPVPLPAHRSCPFLGARRATKKLHSLSRDRLRFQYTLPKYVEQELLLPGFLSGSGGRGGGGTHERCPRKQHLQWPLQILQLLLKFLQPHLLLLKCNFPRRTRTTTKAAVLSIAISVC